MRRVKRNSLIAVLTAAALITCVAVVVALTAGGTHAQSMAGSDACLEACIQLVRSDIQAQKTALITDNLPMTEAEAEAFWPIYRKYEADMASVNNRTIDWLKEYGAAGGVLSDQRAAELLGTWFDIQDQKLRMRRDYSKKFREALPSAKVSRFFQIDNRIDLVLQIQVARNLPLLERAE